MTSFTAVTSLRSRVQHPAVRGWALAVAVYFLAVFHRSSLGVAGLLAERRFGITDGQLGVFVLLQIGVYAAMQIPTGVLVDRYGPRRVLIIAASVMGLGQLLFALTPSYGAALVARALLGCGDALTFISVLRYASVRFTPRRYPVLVALTSSVGMLGSVFATLPLAALLTGVGWAPTFTGAALVSLVAAAAVAFRLDDGSARPPKLRSQADVRAGLGSVTRRVRAAWALPGTRLGFWVHFACMSTATAFAVLWGHPYLVDGVGFSSSTASAILMVGVVIAGLGGLLVGWLIGRWANLRVSLALVVSTATILGWSVVVFGLGDHPPRVLVAVLFALTMLGGPASMVAFALARDYNHSHILGTASGVVNVGGFVATALVSVGFGWTLSALGGTSAAHLRLALLVPIGVQLFGTTRVFVWLRRLRTHVVAEQRRGTSVPVSVSRRFPWDHRWEQGWQDGRQPTNKNRLAMQG